ncbi:MAG: hypothetical protein AAF840_16950, partial [Bacteroidota bacterium]
TQNGTWFLALLISLIVFSCTEDEEALLPTESPDNAATELRPGQGDSPTPEADMLSASIVNDWTEVLLATERYAEGMRPNASARALAYIYLAAYETALPSMRGYVSNAEQLPGLRIDRNRNGRPINVELALNACFSIVLEHFLLNVPIEHKDAISTFAADKRALLTIGLSERAVTEAEAWGSYVAQQVITYSQTDEEAEAQILEPQPLSYEPPVGPGFWTYSADPERALYPYWERVRTFVISPHQTTTVPPINYSTEPNSPYRQQMEEVYTANNAARAEDGEQLWIAEFWSDDVENLMMSPPARQIAITNQLIEQYSLSLAASLELLVRVGFSLNDAAVAAWKYKYQHMVMRPSVYLKDFVDPNYQTNLFRLVFWPDPGFPGYPSGHSCFASAAGGVFIETFGEQTTFTDRTHEGRTEFRGAPRTFSSFAQLAEENAFSRIPLGVHMRM